MATADEVGGKTMTEFIPIKDLEAEFNSVGTKFRNELQKAHERCSTQQDEIIKLKKELQQAEQRHSREQHYLQNMNEENKSHIERLNEHIKSMNIKIKELNSEHSKETEQLKFELNEVNHSLTSKINEEKIRTTEMEYKMCTLKEESAKYSETEKNLNAKIARLTSEKKQQHSRLELLRKSYEGLEQELAKQRNQLNGKVTEQEKLIHEKDQENQQKESKIQQLTSDIHKMKPYYDHYPQLDKARQYLDFQLRIAEETIHTVREKNLALVEEKQNLLLRLNKLPGANPTYNSPNIADLSDEKTPTKLAEEFSELYDNEWTDAFEEVDIIDEKTKITFMLELLQLAYQLCHHANADHSENIQHSLSSLTIRMLETATPAEQKSDECSEDTTRNYEAEEKGKVEDTEDDQTCVALNTTSKTEEAKAWKAEKAKPKETEIERTITANLDTLKVRNEQKKAVQAIQTLVEKTLSRELQEVGAELIAKPKGIDSEKDITVTSYIRKCIDVCWSICLQEPPVHVDFGDVTDDTPFDTNKYKPYTKSGKYLDFIVWPALYLHEDGPMLSKGVANGKK